MPTMGWAKGMFANLGTSILGSTQKSHNQPEVIRPDSRRAGAHASSESDELPSSLAKDTPRKRVREGSEDDRGSNKRLRQPSADEKRLLGNPGRVPTSAVKVVIPVNRSSDDEFQVTGPQRGGRGMGAPSKPRAGRGYKPVNTLSHENHATKRAGTVQLSAAQALRARTSTQASGYTGISTKKGVGDAFDGPEPQPKRQKTNQLPLARSDQIEIADSQDGTGDFNAFTRGSRVSDRQTSGRHSSVISVDSQSQTPSQSQSQSRSQSQYFDNKPFQNAIKHTDSKPRPVQRKRLSDINREPSQKSSTLGHPSARPHNKNGSREVPVELVDDDESVQLASRSNRELQTPAKQHDRPPPIDLMRDIDDYKRTADVEKLNKAITKSMAPHQVPHTGRVNGTKIAQSPQTTRRPSNRVFTPFHARATEPVKNTRDAFNRDTIGTSNSQRLSKATARMQANPSPTADKAAKEVLESLDQQRNGMTIRSRSPEADTSIRHRPRPEPARPASPSDLPPPVFKSVKHQTAKPHTSKKPVGHSDSAEEYRLPIAAIYSRGCVVNKERGGAQTLDLVWDAEENWFKVEKDGLPQLIPNKQELYHIGTTEASGCKRAKNFLTIMFTGSRTSCSIDKLLVQFLDSEDLGLAMDLLRTAAGERFKDVHVANEKMAQLIKIQRVEIQQDAQKQDEMNARNAKLSSLADLQDMQRSKNSAEAIVYESGYESESRQPASRRIVQSKPTDDSVSRHFSPVSEPRRSGRQPKPIKRKSATPEPPPRWTRQHRPEAWHHSVLYPQQGVRKVTVDFQDLERLDEGEFLNDNLVGYALRRIEEGMDPEHKDKVYFFNSFFFTSLTTKNGKKALNYEAVAKWTKSKELFNYPYIVVPINDNLHWYVAIICNLPNLERKMVGLEDEEKDVKEEPDSHIQNAASVLQTQSVPNSQDDAKPNTDELMHRLSISDDGATEETPNGNDDQLVLGDDGRIVSDVEENGPPAAGKLKRTTSTTKGKKSKKRAAPPPRKYDPDQPIIITLDSFGSAHTADITKLKDYLKAEGQTRRAMQVDRDKIQGMTAKGIPEQTNFCDCGVFLVGYVEEFAKDPRAFVTKVVRKELDDKNDFKSFDPSRKRADLRNDLLQLYHSQDEARKTAKKQKRVEKEALAKKEASSPAKAADLESLKPPRPNPALPISNASSPTKVLTPKVSWAPLEVSLSAEGPPIDSSEGQANAVNGHHEVLTGPAVLSQRGHEQVVPPIETEEEDKDLLEAFAPRALPSSPEPQSRRHFEDPNQLEVRGPTQPGCEESGNVTSEFEDPNHLEVRGSTQPDFEDSGNVTSESEEMLDDPSRQGDDAMQNQRSYRKVDASPLQGLEDSLEAATAAANRTAQPMETTS